MAATPRNTYLTEEQWAILQPLIPLLSSEDVRVKLICVKS